MNPSIIQGLKAESPRYTYENFAKIQPRTDRHYEYEEEYYRWRRKVEELIYGQHAPDEFPHRLLKEALNYQDINRGEAITPEDFNRARDLMLQALDASLRGHSGFRSATLQSALEIDSEEPAPARTTQAKVVEQRPSAPQSPIGQGSVLLYANRLDHRLAKETVRVIETMLEILDLKGVLAQGNELFSERRDQGLSQGILSHQAAVVCVGGDDMALNERLSEDQLVGVGAVCALYRGRLLLLWDQRLTVPDPLRALPRVDIGLQPMGLLEGLTVMHEIKRFALQKGDSDATDPGQAGATEA